jgi:hypothetical protein
MSVAWYLKLLYGVFIPLPRSGKTLAIFGARKKFVEHF